MSTEYEAKVAAKFEHEGVTCLVLHMPGVSIARQAPYHTGYINIVNELHPWWGKHYNEIFSEVKVHGGLTYSEVMAPDRAQPNGWWIGFDTNHSSDGPEEKTLAYAVEQCKLMATQAVAAAVEQGKLWLVRASAEKPEWEGGLVV